MFHRYCTSVLLSDLLVIYKYLSLTFEVMNASSIYANHEYNLQLSQLTSTTNLCKVWEYKILRKVFPYYLEICSGLRVILTLFAQLVQNKGFPQLPPSLPVLRNFHPIAHETLSPFLCLPCSPPQPTSSHLEVTSISLPSVSLLLVHPTCI